MALREFFLEIEMIRHHRELAPYKEEEAIDGLNCT